MIFSNEQSSLTITPTIEEDGSQRLAIFYKSLKFEIETSISPSGAAALHREIGAWLMSLGRKKDNDGQEETE